MAAAIIGILSYISGYFIFAPIPELVLNGEREVNVESHTTYTDPGLTATLGKKDLTEQVRVIGVVDTTKPGPYTLTYQLTLHEKTYSTSRTVTVVDKEAPVLELTGNGEMIVSLESLYQEPGYTANDRCDGDLTDKVVVERVVEGEQMTGEREPAAILRKLTEQYSGAEIVLTDGKKGMSGAVEKAVELSKEIEGSFIAGQFENPANPKIHRETTGVEIWDDTDGKVDIFVAGVGTGGTLTGVGEYLKSKNPDIKIVAVEPLSSPLLSQDKSGSHGIQGIGANFVPKVLNREIYDEIIPVSDENAMKTGKALARQEGILVGISSGAAVYAATELAMREENKGKTIVALLPDTGERYMSTEMFI